MRTRVRAAVAVAALTTVAGCGATADFGDATGTAVDQPTQTPSEPTVTPDARYPTVRALVDAAIEAGYECRRWRQNNKVATAAESATCSGDSVFSTYSSDAALQEQLEIHREMDEMFTELDMSTDPRLVGPNWIINAPEAPQLAGMLGGIVESSS